MSWLNPRTLIIGLVLIGGAILLGFSGVLGSITGRNDKPPKATIAPLPDRILPPTLEGRGGTSLLNSSGIPTLTPQPTIVPTPRPLVEGTQSGGGVKPSVLPTPTMVIQTVTPVPTPTLVVTPTPESTLEPTFIPTFTPRPSPTPPPPPPSPTSRYRAIEPDETFGHPSFEYTSGPVLFGSNTINFSAVINTKGLAPTQIQVWQSLDRQDYGGACSTERPIAFVRKGSSSGATRYDWLYCAYFGSLDQLPCGDRYKGCESLDGLIPWVQAASWSYSQRITPPRSGNRHPPPTGIFDFRVSISLLDERVNDLRYSSPEAYIVVVFSGNTILARTWIALPE